MSIPEANGAGKNSCCHGSGDLEITIDSEQTLKDALPLLQRSYESS